MSVNEILSSNKLISIASGLAHCNYSALVISNIHWIVSCCIAVAFDAIYCFICCRRSDTIFERFNEIRRELQWMQTIYTFCSFLTKILESTTLKARISISIFRWFMCQTSNDSQSMYVWRSSKDSYNQLYSIYLC